MVKLQRFPREIFDPKIPWGCMIQFDDIRCLLMGSKSPTRGASVGFSLVLVVWCYFFWG